MLCKVTCDSSYPKQTMGDISNDGLPPLSLTVRSIRNEHLVRFKKMECKQSVYFYTLNGGSLYANGPQFEHKDIFFFNI